MKKEYSMPAMEFESFELSQSIAAGCENIITAVEEMCYITLDKETVLFSHFPCTFTPPEADDNLCYHAPTDDSTVFSS